MRRLSRKSRGPVQQATGLQLQESGEIVFWRRLVVVGHWSGCSWQQLRVSALQCKAWQQLRRTRTAPSRTMIFAPITDADD